MDELMEELLRQTGELNEAHETIFKLQEENESMHKTIETILRLKCKRGEGAFALNIDLRTCVRNNVAFALSKLQRDISSGKAVEVVSEALVDLLIGESRTDIPCAVLDANTVVYKTINNLWYASNLIELADIIRDAVGVHNLLVYFDEHWRDGKYTHVYNMFLHDNSFLLCLRTALRKYKDL